MLQDAIDSLGDIVSPPFRAVMVKSVALTFAVLALGGYALDRFAVSFVTTEHGWLAYAISLLIGIGVVAGLVLLAAPTASLVASFYLDEMAGIVEREVDPQGVPGRPAPALDAALCALRFAALTLAVLLFALVFLFVPGLGFVAWFAANAYLLGREYFELAAMRFRPAAEARAMRRHFSIPIYFAGMFIAGFVAVPVLNLWTPLFATALMVRLHKRLAAAEVRADL